MFGVCLIADRRPKPWWYRLANLSLTKRDRNASVTMNPPLRVPRPETMRFCYSPSMVRSNRGWRALDGLNVTEVSCRAPWCPTLQASHVSIINGYSSMAIPFVQLFMRILWPLEQAFSCEQFFFESVSQICTSSTHTALL